MQNLKLITMKWPEFNEKYKILDITDTKNTKIESESATIDETPEDLFDIYEKSRSVSDYQKLYNKGIKLHEIRGNEWTPCDYFDPRPEQSFIKVYDIIDGKMTFTKIGVY